MAMHLVPPSFLPSRLPSVINTYVGKASCLMASRMISSSSAKDSPLASATSWKLVLSAPMPVFLLNDFAAALIASVVILAATSPCDWCCNARNRRSRTAEKPSLILSARSACHWSAHMFL